MTNTQAVLQIIRIVSEAIREAKRIPAGHLYAMLMAYGCTLEQFNQLTTLLVDSGVVAREGQELVWKGVQS